MAKAKWELLMTKIDALISESNASLYDRSVLLKQVWDDPAFLDFHNRDIDQAESHLNEKLGDYGVTIFDCLSLLKHFPEKLDWAKGNLRDMLAVALDKERQARAAVVAYKPERKGPVARSEFDKLEQQLGHVNSRADSLAEENGRLREENARLRSELDRANGRIAELQSILKREFAAA